MTSNITQAQTITSQSIPMVETKGAGSKYRNLIRGHAVNLLGWTMVPSPLAKVDRFTKDGVTLDVHHGPKDLVTMVERVAQDGSWDIIPQKAGSKLNHLYSWLSGQPVNFQPHLLMKSQELALHDWLQAEFQFTNMQAWLAAELAHYQAWLDAEAKHNQASTKPAPKPRSRAPRAKAQAPKA